MQTSLIRLKPSISEQGEFALKFKVGEFKEGDELAGIEPLSAQNLASHLDRIAAYYKKICLIRINKDAGKARSEDVYAIGERPSKRAADSSKASSSSSSSSSARSGKPLEFHERASEKAKATASIPCRNWAKGHCDYTRCVYSHKANIPQKP